MFNTINNAKNVTSTLYLTTYPVLHKVLVIGHTQLQYVTLTKR